MHALEATPVSYISFTEEESIHPKNQYMPIGCPGGVVYRRWGGCHQ